MINQSDILFVLLQVIDLELFMLSYQDSNLDKQAQNLLCYHYTIRHCLFESAKIQNIVTIKKNAANIFIFSINLPPLAQLRDPYNDVVGWHKPDATAGYRRCR